MSVESVRPVAAVAATDNDEIRTLLQALGLKAGDTVSARVSGMVADNIARLAIGDATLDVGTAEPLPVGTTLTMKVEQKGQSLLLMTALPQDKAAPAAGPAILATPAPPAALPQDRTVSTIVAALVDMVGRQATGPTDAGEVAVAARGAPDIARAGEANAAPKAAATPREALVDAVRSAAARQDGLGALFADAGAVMTRQAVGTLPPLPQPVAQALSALLGFQLPAQGAADPAQLQKALTQSGIFLESSLAGQAGAPPPDLKAALANLRQALDGWLADLGLAKDEEPPHGFDHARPPVRGALPQGQQPATSPLATGGTPAEVAQRLSEKTDAALARMTLLQAASLPDAGDTRRPDIAAQVTVEVPLRIGVETAMVQIQVSREKEQESDGRPGARPRSDWTLRFSMDAEPLGPVHAAIRLHAGHVGVRLWAERDQVAARLEAASGELTNALEASAFAVDRVQVSAGRPPDPRAEPSAATRPHRLDRST